MHSLKPKPVTSRLAPDEIARIRRFRAMLENAIEKMNDIVEVTYAEFLEEAAARKAARAAAQPAEKQPTKPQPAKNQTGRSDFH